MTIVCRIQGKEFTLEQMEYIVSVMKQRTEMQQRKPNQPLKQWANLNIKSLNTDHEPINLEPPSPILSETEQNLLNSQYDNLIEDDNIFYKHNRYQTTQLSRDESNNLFLQTKELLSTSDPYIDINKKAEEDSTFKLQQEQNSKQIEFWNRMNVDIEKLRNTSLEKLDNKFFTYNNNN